MDNSLATWIELAFNVRLAKYPEFKNRLNSYIRNNTIASSSLKENHVKDSRGKRLIPSSQKETLYNVVILDAFFGNVSFVKRVFNEPAARTKASEILSLLFSECHSVINIPLSSSQFTKMLEMLDSNRCLQSAPLPNPFIENKLPQILLPNISSLANISLAKAMTSTPSNDFIQPYLDGNITLAYESLPITTNSPHIKQLIEIISAKYDEIVEFENTLELFE